MTTIHKDWFNDTNGTFAATSDANNTSNICNKLENPYNGNPYAAVENEYAISSSNFEYQPVLNNISDEYLKSIYKLIEKIYQDSIIGRYNKYYYSTPLLYPTPIYYSMPWRPQRSEPIKDLPIAEQKIYNYSGVTCKKCNDFNEYCIEPSEADGHHLCYKCRNRL